MPGKYSTTESVLLVQTWAKNVFKANWWNLVRFLSQNKVFLKKAEIV